MPNEPDPKDYNRAPTDISQIDTFEFFLTDAITLNAGVAPQDFEQKGLALRAWFEGRTGWSLVMSGVRLDDAVVMNLWKINPAGKRADLNALSTGLGRLRQDPETPLGYGRLLELFAEENHFVAYSRQWAMDLPHPLDGKDFCFAYTEYLTRYDNPEQFENDIGVGLDSFPALWQFVANVRALSGRVNTVAQYWLVPIDKGADRGKVQAQIRQDAPRSRWGAKADEYRPLRVDLLVPTLYDPSRTPR
jgi:hypothetical protein